MIVKVNDRKIDYSGERQRTLQGLIEELRQRDELPPAEAVSAVVLDDEEWEGRELPDVLERELDGVDRVCLLTSDLREYAQEILSESDGILDVLLHRTREVAGGFRNSEPAAANVRLFRLLDAIHRFLVCLCTIQNACSPEFKPFDGQSGPLTKVAESLDRIEDSQYSEDWKELATSLEKHLHPALSELSGSITALKEAI